MPKNQTFYIINALRTNKFNMEARTQLIAKTKIRLQNSLRKQTNDQIDRYVQYHKELTKQMMTSFHYKQRKHLLYKAIEFDTIYASQAQRFQTIHPITNSYNTYYFSKTVKPITRPTIPANPKTSPCTTSWVATKAAPNNN